MKDYLRLGIKNNENNENKKIYIYIVNADF